MTAKPRDFARDRRNDCYSTCWFCGGARGVISKYHRNVGKSVLVFVYLSVQVLIY